MKHSVWEGVEGLRKSWSPPPQPCAALPPPLPVSGAPPLLWPLLPLECAVIKCLLEITVNTVKTNTYFPFFIVALLRQTSIPVFAVLLFWIRNYEDVIERVSLW